MHALARDAVTEEDETFQRSPIDEPERLAPPHHRVEVLGSVKGVPGLAVNFLPLRFGHGRMSRDDM